MRALNRIFKGRRGPQLLPLAAKIRAMFANGEQGVWYDPSDFTTLFQDSAGTTPVTAVEQPVGLMLDKSKGLVKGPELIVNGTFATDVSGWTASAGVSITWESGAARVVVSPASFGGVFSTNFTTVIGTTYEVLATISDNTGGNASVIAQTSGGSNIGSIATAVGNGTYRGVFTATTTLSRLFVGNTNSAATSRLLDNISIKELPGNHAFQSTSASRPVLSARVNLLTNTAFTGTVAGTPGTPPTNWTLLSVGGSIVSAANGVITFSASSQRQIISQTITIPANESQKWSTVVVSNGNNLPFNNLFSAVTTGTATLIAKANGVVVSGSYVPVANDLLTIEIANTATQITPTFRIGVGTTGAATGTVSFCNPDARVTNDGVGLPVYQRVNTATDYDTVGFPLYLRADGVDDGMATNSINFTATDKMTVCAGVRKLSDATTNIIAELSSNTNSNNGSFLFFSTITPGYGWYSKGSILSTALSPQPITSPITNVLTGIGDISGPQATLRINGTQAATSSATQGTGNYGNYPLYLFRRGGTTLPFNGCFYGMTVVGRTLSTGEIFNLEQYTNFKTKAYA